MNLIKICVRTCDMTLRSYFGKMNSTLRSFVLLAMFYQYIFGTPCMCLAFFYGLATTLDNYNTGIVPLIPSSPGTVGPAQFSQQSHRQEACCCFCRNYYLPIVNKKVLIAFLITFQLSAAETPLVSEFLSFMSVHIADFCRLSE